MVTLGVIMGIGKGVGKPFNLMDLKNVDQLIVANNFAI
jgi:hypothetical protein